MEPNAKQDKELINSLLDTYDVHYKQKPLFQEYLMKCANYLKTEYNYTVTDFFNENAVATLEEAFEGWKSNIEPVHLIDDFFALEYSLNKKKILENLLRKPNKIDGWDKANN